MDIDTRTVYISIGNSDDKLTQQEWSNFVTETDILLRPRGAKELTDYDPFWPIKARHGSWRSVPDDSWQNACWCVEIEDEPEALHFIQDELAALAKAYQQDSIAWAEATTEFIKPAKADEEPICGHILTTPPGASWWKCALPPMHSGDHTNIDGSKTWSSSTAVTE